MKDLMIKLWKEEEGASLLEYGLLIAFMAVVGVAALSLFGQGLINLFASAESAVEDASGATWPTTPTEPE